MILKIGLQNPMNNTFSFQIVFGLIKFYKVSEVSISAIHFSFLLLYNYVTIQLTIRLQNSMNNTFEGKQKNDRFI